MAVTITKPASGAVLAGTTSVEATYSGSGFDIATVTFSGQQLASDSALPLAFSVDTSRVADGAYTLIVAVRYRTNGGKLRWQKASIPVTVKNSVASWVKVADEHESFTLAETMEVRYGTGTSWNSKILPAGTHLCENSVFGDPVIGLLKECQARATDEEPPPPPPLPSNVARSAPTSGVIS